MFQFDFITFIGKKNNIYYISCFLLFICSLNITYCTYIYILSDIGYILRNIPIEDYEIETLAYKELYELMSIKNTSTGFVALKNVEVHFDFIPNNDKNMTIDLLNQRMFASAYRVKSSYK